MSRRRDRRLAVDVLYAADVRGCNGAELLAERRGNALDVPGYAEHLVREVDRRRGEIDALLSRHATGWPPERMSAVDRNVLRVGVLELLETGVPDAVAMDEAVQIAKTYSGNEAGRFVNGVLAGVREARDADAAV